MVKLVDTLDLKSSEQQCSCGFKSRSEYKSFKQCLELFYFMYIWHFDHKTMGAFVISKRLSGDYKFEFTSRKGKTIFTSNPFELKFECEQEIELLKASIGEAVFLRFKSSSNKYFFRLIVNEREIAMSRKYTTQLLLQKGIDEIIRYTISSEILDFSINQDFIFEAVLS
jgi:uncharacterized protein